MNDNVVEDYGWVSTEGPQSCNYIAPRIVAILESLDVKRVMDLGSGNGALCALLSTAGHQVVGIEYDKKGVEVARQSHPSVPFYNFGVQDNPTALMELEQPFDAVVSTEVIEHLFSPHLLITYARHVLRPGGHLVITTPYHGYLKNLVLSILNKWDAHHTVLWHGGHIKFWSRTTLSKLLMDNGFHVTAFSGVGRYPYLWKSMVLVAQKDGTT